MGLIIYIVIAWSYWWQKVTKGHKRNDTSWGYQGQPITNQPIQTGRVKFKRGIYCTVDPINYAHGFVFVGSKKICIDFDVEKSRWETLSLF